MTESSVETQTAAGLTWAIFGLAVAGIFTTYNAVGPVAETLPGYVVGGLWVPWILAGMALSRLTSSQLGVERSFDPRSGADWARAGASILAVYGIQFAVGQLPDAWGPNALNLAYAGGLAVLFAGWQRFTQGIQARVGVAVGLVTGASSAVLGIAGLARPVAGLVAAGVAGGAFLGTGAVLVRGAGSPAETDPRHDAP